MQHIRLNMRPLSDAQAKQAVRFLSEQGIPDAQKDSVLVVSVSDEVYAALVAYQDANALPPAFLLEEEAD